MDDQRIFLRPPLWLPIIVVLLAGGFYITGKKIEAKPTQPAIISVTGEGKISAVPDIAELSFGVQTGPQRTAKAAMDLLSKNMTAALDAVKAQGIDEKDIHTESFWLNPQYDWNEGKQTLRGYEASQSLRVKVRNLDKVSDVLNAATEVGANQAGGVNFTIDNPEVLRAQARDEAITKAKEQAKMLADQLGVTLVELKGFNENGGYGAPPMPYYARAEMDMAGSATAPQSVPMPAGEQDIVVSVSLTYEVK